jgi:hypothetical protein
VNAILCRIYVRTCITLKFSSLREIATQREACRRFFVLIFTSIKPVEAKNKISLLNDFFILVLDSPDILHFHHSAVTQMAWRLIPVNCFNAE